MSHSSRIVCVIASIYGVRMLGLFMLLPVLSLYADDLSGATALTIGIALGCYGLTQALLQIPFAILSDYIGRRNALLLGLTVFVAGSVVASLAEDIFTLIVGRCLQGAGAIAGILLAVLSDGVDDDKRVRANAVVGLVIGMAFVLALVCAPLLSSAWGLTGIFVFNGLSAMLVLFVARYFLPPDKKRQKILNSTVAPSKIADLCVGIFLLHTVLTACFLAVPWLLLEVGNLEKESHWSAYLISLSIAAVLAWPVLRSREQISDRMIYIATVLILLSTLILAHANMLVAMLIGLGIFFAGFSILESFFPALLSRRLRSHEYGIANGCFSACQFIGSFTGGLLGGLLLSSWDITVLLYCVAPLMFCWAIASKISRSAHQS